MNTLLPLPCLRSYNSPRMDPSRSMPSSRPWNLEVNFARLAKSISFLARMCLRIKKTNLRHNNNSNDWPYFDGYWIRLFKEVYKSKREYLNPCNWDSSLARVAGRATLWSFTISVARLKHEPFPPTSRTAGRHPSGSIAKNPNFLAPILYIPCKKRKEKSKIHLLPTT